MVSFLEWARRLFWGNAPYHQPTDHVLFLFRGERGRFLAARQRECIAVFLVLIFFKNGVTLMEGIALMKNGGGGMFDNGRRVLGKKGGKREELCLARARKGASKVFSGPGVGCGCTVAVLTCLKDGA